PSIAARFSATTRAMLLARGDAHRLNSSSETWFVLTATTICGRSTASGTETGLTSTERSDDAGAGADGGAGVSVEKREAGEDPQPAAKTTRTRSTRIMASHPSCPGVGTRDGGRGSPPARAATVRRA